MRGVSANGAILGAAMKDLREHWERSSMSWRDRARAEFEKNFIDQLVPSVRAASNAVQQIEELLRQVQRECG